MPEQFVNPKTHLWHRSRPRTLPLIFPLQVERAFCALLILSLLVVPLPANAQSASLSGQHATVFNAIGDVEVSPNQDEFGRIEVSIRADGRLFDRLRVNLRSRRSVVTVLLPSKRIREGGLAREVRLPITPDWRFGDGVVGSDTVTFTTDLRATSLRVSVEVRVPQGMSVTINSFIGEVAVAGQDESYRALGVPTSLTIENVNGELQMVGKEGE